MAAPETGFFRGAGGGVFELSLPLSENFENQRVRGQLVQVNADGEAVRSVAPKTRLEPGGEPPVSAKNEWVGYAAAVESDLSVDDADAMTKNDLIEKYGK
jgi:hypothetical protein